MIAALLTASACGPDGTETTAQSTSTAPVICPDVAGLAAAVRPEITYDYEPAADPVAVADRATLTIRATGVSGIDREGDWLVFSVEAVEVIADGHDSAGPAPNRFALEMGPLYEGPPALAAYRDLEMVVSLHTFADAPTGLVADLEGFWIACGVETEATSVVVEPTGAGWTLPETVETIATDIRRSRGIVAGVWNSDGLGCYGPLAEHNELEPLMGGQVDGFGSPEAAAADWLAQRPAPVPGGTDATLEVDLPQVRYLDEHGNAQAVLHLVETDVGGFVVEWDEVCYYP